jgi:hypothetical protein
MTLWLIVIIASLACVALKIGGYLVPESFLEKPMPSRVANLLTVALLAALVAVQTLAAGTQLVLDARVPAILVAAGLFALRVPFIVVVSAAGVQLAFQLVHSRQPGLTSDAPSVLPNRLCGGLGVEVLQPVHVEHPVEVVVLMLEDAREPAVGVHLEWDVLPIHGPQHRKGGAAQREPLARNGQAALGLFLLVRITDRNRSDPQLGVDGDAAPPGFVVIRPVVHEHAQRHSHLRSRESDPGGGLHGVEQVRQ